MMEYEAFQARAEFYFKDTSCPIAVQRVAAANAAQHRFDLTLEPHYHDFFELVIVTQGGGIQVIDGEELFVGAGELFLLGGQNVHFFRDRHLIGLVNVQFDPQKLPLPLDWLRQLAGFREFFDFDSKSRTLHRQKLDGEQLAQLLGVVEKLERELHTPTPGMAVAALALLLELIVYLSRTFDSLPVPNVRVSDQIAKAVHLIEHEYSQPWTLPELARHCATSPNTLLRKFREVLGTTPIDYLKRIRLQQAARQLAAGGTVSETAASCGFRDSNYFSRCFRTAYGVVPHEYRRNLQKVAIFPQKLPLGGHGP